MFKIIVTDTPAPTRLWSGSTFRILHERAAAAGVDGILVLASFGEDPVTGVEIKERVQHFKIGDVKGMAETALRAQGVAPERLRPLGDPAEGPRARPTRREERHQGRAGAGRRSGRGRRQGRDH